MTAIIWFRQDLRAADNPALSAAAKAGLIVPLYILEQNTELSRLMPLGGASRWWLHHSLTVLKEDLGGLVVDKGDPEKILPEAVKAVGAKVVYWNRCYEPGAIERDKRIKAALAAQDLEVRSLNASLLCEPWQIKTKAGQPFKVFTPYWRALQQVKPDAPQRRPTWKLARSKFAGIGCSIDELELLPTKPNWAAGLDDLWTPGAAGAHKRLKSFSANGLKGYGALRDRPDKEHVSRLSPHLHFGEISPRQIWSHMTQLGERKPELRRDIDKFLSELAWREFSYHLLYHFPTLPEQNWKPEFDAYPWRCSKKDLRSWQRGQTGYPMVDAGMRELWQTGFMHNRVRMLVASFLIKHLRLHWRDGHAWFMDTLVDADLANNSASWQWVAGSGADAAPYFRIFNPILQGQKFDPHGDYVRRWCPEIASLPDDYIHCPFDAPDTILSDAGVTLGETYPKPIVDHAKAREAALAGYKDAKANAEDVN